MSEEHDQFVVNAYKHWKENSCNCFSCSIFRIFVKAEGNIERTVLVRNGFPEYYEVYYEYETNRTKHSL